MSFYIKRVLPWSVIEGKISKGYHVNEIMQCTMKHVKTFSAFQKTRLALSQSGNVVKWGLILYQEPRSY